MRTHYSQKGFTLIEIAIVVIIIGLLTGGVLKGLEILEDTRLQKASDQFRSIQSAWFSYLNRYQQLPGDDNQAQTFLHASANNGDGDGIISSTAEQSNAWQHLYLSGILQGSGNQAAITPWGNAFKFSYSNSKKQHLLCIQDLSNERAAILDKKMDDGIANTGTLFNPSSTNATYQSNTTSELCTIL